MTACTRAGDGPRPVRAGLPLPVVSGRSVRRGSGVKRDFACTCTRHYSPVLVALRSQSCLRLEGRTRTLSGPSPELSPARTLAPSARRGDLLICRSRHIVQDRQPWSVRWADIPPLSVGGRRCPPSWQQFWQQSRDLWNYCRVMSIPPVRSALVGNRRLAATWAEVQAPSRADVWRNIRAFRHDPPGPSNRGARKKVFGSALEQAEQLFSAAEEIGYAARPILLFYGLSQAGRAIAAACKACTSDWRLSGHGIAVKNLGQRASLDDVKVADQGSGSFTQLAPMLNSGTLPDDATLGQIWSTIPDLADQPLPNSGGQFPPLRFVDNVHIQNTGIPALIIHGSIGGLPRQLIGAADPWRAVQQFLDAYPSLMGSEASHLCSNAVILEYTNAPTVKAVRFWPWSGFSDPSDGESAAREFVNSRTIPYLGDDRWAFPPSAAVQTCLHPLLAWWALLYALSMLARYEPDTWTCPPHHRHQPHRSSPRNSTRSCAGHLSPTHLASDPCSQRIAAR